MPAAWPRFSETRQSVVKLEAGAVGEIELKAKKKVSILAKAPPRKKGAATHGSERLVASADGPSVRDQLYAILKKNAMRV